MVRHGPAPLGPRVVDRVAVTLDGGSRDRAPSEPFLDPLPGCGAQPCALLGRVEQAAQHGEERLGVARRDQHGGIAGHLGQGAGVAGHQGSP